jgi:arsenate reductase
MTAHWGLPDPAAVTTSEAERHIAFGETYKALLRRIQAFTSLPMATLDALSLQARLRDIGRDGAPS